MKVFFMKLAVWIANIIYLPFRVLKIREKVVILSRQSNEPSIDIILLSKELTNKNIKHVILTKKLEKRVCAVIAYAFHMLRQMFHIATSKVVIVDGYCILVSILPKNKNQKIIQIWHALGAIKEFGWQTIDKQWGSSRAVAETMKLHRNYDYAIAPSAITAKHFSEAFCIDKDKVMIMGLPRIDYLLSDNPEKIQQIKNSYPQISEKINVLYAPTFRKSTSIEISDLVDSFDFTKFNLIFKKHWLDKSDYSWAEEKGVIIDEKYNSMDWLKICHKLITDYSAITFEAAILEKEIYFYLTDEKDYIDKVGLNINLRHETIGDYVYSNAGALCSCIDDEYCRKLVRQFKDKYIEIKLESVSLELVRRIIDF